MTSLSLGRGFPEWAAATAAADGGATVLLVDENGFLGGSTFGVLANGETTATRDELGGQQ